MSRSTRPPSAAAAGSAGPVPSAGSGLTAKGGAVACGRAQVGPPTAAAQHARLQVKEERQFQAKAGRASWQSGSGLCNHLLVSSNVEDFAHLF